MRFAVSLVALGSALVPGALAAQSQLVDEPREKLPEEAQESAGEKADATTPAPPPEARLPEIEPVIEDEEFDASIPELDPQDDPELQAPLESIEEFERRIAAQDAEADSDSPAAPPEGDAPLGDPALADGDPVEAIGDAPIRDEELARPLPPLEGFDPEPVEFAEEPAFEELEEIEYVIVVNGLGEADAATPANLEDMFDDFSSLEEGDGEAANIAQVSARLEEDGLLMERLLAAEGFYAARIETRIDRSGLPNGQPLSAIINVTPGQRFSFGAITIDAAKTEPPGLIDNNFPLEPGQPIVAARVQGAEANIAVQLPQNGYPFAEIGQRDILLDRATGEGDYTLPVTIGPRARFGGVRLAGDDPVFDGEHVEVLARFERGDLYDSRLVDDLRQAMVATGLFSTVSIQAERAGQDGNGNEARPREDGTVDAVLVVEQNAGPPRTISGGVGFGTGQGFRVDGSWTHRNLFPPEGALIADAVLGTQEQGAGVTFRRSNAGKRDRTFSVTAEALRSNFEAFEAFTGRLSALVSYDSTELWQKPVTYSYGAQLIATDEQDFDFARGELNRRTFFIGGLIGQVGIDRTNSLLDARNGFRVTALIEPEGSLQGDFTPYVRARLDASAYYSPSDAITLAGRVRLGTVQGIDRFDLAPSRRLYSGGGGSVRGFGFQELGPKVEIANPRFDPDDPDETRDPTIVRPIGGLSQNEAAVEVRYRFGNFGVVAFLDAGQVYESSEPQFDNIRFGAGLGARYYTNFGPLRLDVGIPIDRQRGESAVAVYVSIGQAF